MIEKLAKTLGAIMAISAFLAAFIVWLPTPVHTDAEAAEIQLQTQSAAGCATIYQYEAMIAKAKAQLNNPSIPEWRKAELRNSIDEWLSVVARLRMRYDC